MIPRNAFPHARGLGAAHITDGGTITGTVTIFWINTGNF